MSVIVRCSNSPSPQPSPGLPGEGAKQRNQTVGIVSAVINRFAPPPKIRAARRFHFRRIRLTRCIQPQPDAAGDRPAARESRNSVRMRQSERRPCRRHAAAAVRPHAPRRIRQPARPSGGHAAAVGKVHGSPGQNCYRSRERRGRRAGGDLPSAAVAAASAEFDRAGRRRHERILALRIDPGVPGDRRPLLLVRRMQRHRGGRRRRCGCFRRISFGNSRDRRVDR